jgi:hypothetical protein
METWIKLLGMSQDSAAVKAALTSAGVKKIPKLDRDDFSVIFDLKGHGMTLEMTDEAYLRRLKDQDIGEGALILTAVDAYLERRKSRDLYTGELPYGLSANMTRAEVQDVLGSPVRSHEDIPADIWTRDGLEVTAGFTKELKLAHLALEVPRSAG